MVAKPGRGELLLDAVAMRRVACKWDGGWISKLSAQTNQAASQHPLDISPHPTPSHLICVWN